MARSSRKASQVGSEDTRDSDSAACYSPLPGPGTDQSHMLHGRLGLETARIPHADRHGLLWLDRGNLTVEAGCLRFVTAGGSLPPGDYQIPINPYR